MYHPQHSLLLVGGQGEDEEEEDGEPPCASQHGISAWRLLSDTPHYKMVTDYEHDLKMVSSPLCSLWYLILDYPLFV